MPPPPIDEDFEDGSPHAFQENPRRMSYDEYEKEVLPSLEVDYPRSTLVILDQRDSVLEDEQVWILTDVETWGGMPGDSSIVASYRILDPDLPNGRLIQTFKSVPRNHEMIWLPDVAFETHHRAGKPGQGRGSRVELGRKEPGKKGELITGRFPDFTPPTDAAPGTPESEPPDDGPDLPPTA